MTSRRVLPQNCFADKSAKDRPILFLDFDDVIALGTPYGGHHLLMKPQPKDLYLRLWHPPAIQALQEVVEQAQPAIVLTTAWLRFLDLAAARQLFKQTDASFLACQLHPKGEAPQGRGQTRLEAIDAWMARHGCPTAYAILDDEESGTALVGSKHDMAGRVVLCEVGAGFGANQVRDVLNALERAC